MISNSDSNSFNYEPKNEMLDSLNEQNDKFYKDENENEILYRRILDSVSNQDITDKIKENLNEEKIGEDKNKKELNNFYEYNSPYYKNEGDNLCDNISYCSFNFDNNKEEFCNIPLNTNNKNYNQQKINIPESGNTKIKEDSPKVLSTGIINNVMGYLFRTDTIELEPKKDMKLGNKKRKRRMTKKEKAQMEQGKEKEIKQRGRKSKDTKGDSLHTRSSDDNIIKKINTNLIESIRKWLNSSFLDENKEIIKVEKFKKLDPALVSTNLKKEFVEELLNKKLMNIFSYKISPKYTSIQNKDHNYTLINEIFNNSEQTLLQNILSLTFRQALSLFNGKDVEGEKELNTKSFDKIDVFLKKLYAQEIKKNDENFLKEYFERIILLSLEYEHWYSIKLGRNPKKNDRSTSTYNNHPRKEQTKNENQISVIIENNK